LPVHDATAGYRVFRAEALRATDYQATRADGYAFQVELAYRVARAGWSIVEHPITFRDRTRGTSKMSGRIVREAILVVTKLGFRVHLLRQGIPPKPH
jgi:dolichol-phosphate mannosyltransferase